MSVTNKQDFGTKLLNELMVDIIGALIPGFLFIIVVTVSVIIPFLVCWDISFDVFKALFSGGGFWWVSLIICLIFSYVIGHVVYRGDIAVPDRRDVERQVRKFVRKVKRKKYVIDDLRALLVDRIMIIRKRFSDGLEGEQWKFIDNKLLKIIDKAIVDLKNRMSYINTSTKTDNAKPAVKYLDSILTILFLEEYQSSGKIVSYTKLSQASKDVLIEYEGYFKRYFKKTKLDDYGKGILISYCVLHCQMEMGCATGGRCEFPYTNYYKYLIKRNMKSLFKYVDWYAMEERSKNKINSLKIQIQTFANEAYAMINKNESHIRMSSSTWHIAKPLLYVSFTATLVFMILLACELFRMSNCFQGNLCDALYYVPMNYYIAVLLPFCMFALVVYIKRRIVRYIHYQRLREIQYTLQIYSQYEPIIKCRRKMMSEGRDIE